MECAFKPNTPVLQHSISVTLIVLRDHICQAMLRSVGNRQRPPADAQFCGQLRGFFMQNDVRLAAPSARHFNVKPADPRAPASSQSFHDRFLGGKTPGVAFVFPAPLSFAILNFFLSKHPIAETPADTGIFQCVLDALDFNHIDANAYNH